MWKRVTFFCEYLPRKGERELPSRISCWEKSEHCSDLPPQRWHSTLHCGTIHYNWEIKYFKFTHSTLYPPIDSLLYLSGKEKCFWIPLFRCHPHSWIFLRGSISNTSFRRRRRLGRRTTTTTRRRSPDWQKFTCVFLFSELSIVCQLTDWMCV